MKDYVKKVKNHWNSVSDSDWYMSLRTDEQILKLQENPAFAFHPTVFELIKKYMGEVSGKYILLTFLPRSSLKSNFLCNLDSFFPENDRIL